VIRFPDGTGMPMQKGDQLVLEMHYNIGTLKKFEPDQSKVLMEFAKKPVKHELKMNLQVQFAFAIPPKAKNHEVKHTLRSPTGVTIWGIMPHMHKLGAKFKVRMNSGGKNTCLVDIPRWDYNWQENYFFKQPIKVKAGDSFDMTCTFNNTTNQVVTWGDRTNDEMCLNFYIVSIP